MFKKIWGLEYPAPFGGGGVDP